MAGRNWFSNFHPFAKPLIYQEIIFATPEHFFQAMKVPKVDLAIRQKIARAATPAEAKKLGRMITLRPDWEQIKVEVMIFAQRYRFSDPEWRLKLLETRGEIVEWNTWHDRTWGKCTCPLCKGEGKNLLGEILMKLRDEMLLKKETVWRNTIQPSPH